jgi:nucleoside-diphosphate-sugar epimerase
VKLLITGASGFLGRHVVTAALQAGHSVRAIVRPSVDESRLGFNDQVEVFRADLRAPGGFKGLFDGIDVLVHLAAAVKGDEFDQFASTVVTTENLLRCMATSNTKRLVLISSFSVYCYERISSRLDESSPVLGPDNSLYDRDGYAIAKAWQERITREMAEANGWELCVIRPGFIFGPGNEELAGLGFSIGPLFFRVIGGKRLPVTYVENAAEAIIAAVASQTTGGKTLNLIDSTGESTRKYTRQMLRWQGKRCLIVPLPYWLGYWNAKVARLVSRVLFRGKGKLPGILIPCRFAARFKPLRFPNDRIQTVLQWKPKISMDEAIKRTFGK